MQNIMRDQFLIDPEVTFLNHGSFGACPRPVFEAYQRWQRELERQPVEFLGRRYEGLVNEARAALAAYLNAELDNLIFVDNTTSGVNLVARSLDLRPGDEILTTDHEYGACDLTWQYVCARSGAQLVRHAIPLPVSRPADLVESFWAAVTPRTRAIFMSHITSPTALIFPVRAICQRARQAGILTIIDGAHAPGQIPLDVQAVGADVYVGNLHKWLSSARGAAFVYARPEHHDWLVPLVISWGWSAQASFVQKCQWQGTNEVAAWLSVPAAIEFQRAMQWETRRADAHALARAARQRLADLTGLPPLAPDRPDPNAPDPDAEAWFALMVAAPLPDGDLDRLKAALYDDHRIEIPVIRWNGRGLIRASFHMYNTADDLDRLVGALSRLLSL